MLKKNDVIKNAKVIGYSHDGFGIVKNDSLVVFVKYAILNDTIDVKITKVDDRMAYGIMLDYKLPEVKCEHYKQCGGCNLMHMNYDQQIEFKKIVVEDAMFKFGIETKVNDVLINEQPYRYRNKILMPFTLDENNEIALGFYKERSHDVLIIDDCKIQSELANDIKDFVIELLNELGEETVYSDRNKKGNLRHLYIRESQNLGEVQVCFVTKTGSFKNQKLITKQLVSEFKEIKSVVVNENNRDTSAVLGFKNINLYNCNFIHENLEDNKFRLLPNAFFQVNTNQTNKLYNQVIEYANLNKDDIVLDAFCGVGSISLALAKKAKKVVGVEIVKQAIESANVNKKINDITNVEFICNDIEKEVNNFNDKFDVIVVDPPRKGLQTKFINMLIEYKPKRLVYVSCNPATLGRDLKLLSQSYDVVEVTPVDMFSQNHHVESVVLLTSK